MGKIIKTISFHTDDILLYEMIEVEVPFDGKVLGVTLTFKGDKTSVYFELTRQDTLNFLKVISWQRGHVFVAIRENEPDTIVYSSDKLEEALV